MEHSLCLGIAQGVLEPGAQECQKGRRVLAFTLLITVGAGLALVAALVANYLPDRWVTEVDPRRGPPISTQVDEELLSYGRDVDT